MKYIAQFKTCKQVGPDEWETVYPTLEVTESTTIAEIREWVIRTEKISQTRLPYFKLDIKIIEVEPLKPLNL